MNELTGQEYVEWINSLVKNLKSQVKELRKGFDPEKLATLYRSIESLPEMFLVETNDTVSKELGG